jgi:hypothetical protein
MQKEFEVISLDNGSWGVVASIEEQIKPGDLSLDLDDHIVPIDEDDDLDYINDTYKKIIATIGKRLVGLPLVVIRGDNLITEDIKAKATDSLIKQKGTVGATSYIIGYFDGYKETLQEKKYSETDLKNAMLHALTIPRTISGMEKAVDDYIQSINPGLPKRVKIEYEDAIKKGKYGMITCKNCKIVTQPSPEGDIIIPVEVSYD